MVAGIGYGNGQDDALPGLSYDPLRLVISAPQGGYALESALRERGIDVEMADNQGIVCILSLMDGESRLQRLYQALCQIKAKTLRPNSRGPQGNRMPPRELPQRVISLGEAAFATAEKVPLHQAAGRVSAAHVGLYPPGVALCAAGERFSRELIDFLLSIDEKRIFGLPCAGHVLCATMGIGDGWHI
jgi:arginine/lysine/ornithine decarboxylase